MKTRSDSSKNKTSISLVLSSLVIILAGMKLSASILAPFLFALFISIIASFPLFWMYRKGVKKWLAISILIFTMFSIGLILTFVLGTSISGFISSLPKYESILKDNMDSALKLLSGFGVNISKSTIFQYVNPANAFKAVGDIVSQLGNLLANLFLITFISIFVLLEALSLPNKVSYILKDSNVSLDNLKEIGENIKNYLFIKTYMSILTGVVITISLYILKIDFAILWGVLAFLLNYVPNIGSLLAGFPPAMMAFIQYGVTRFIITIIIYLVINIVIGTIIEPKFMGKGLGLSPLIVFLSLIFWGWILGIVGMFLSVPLTMIIKIIFSVSKDKKWVSVLLSDKVE
jgi:predicted PurR-regulated permease PerM